MRDDATARIAALEARDIAVIARAALAEAHMNYPVPRYMSQQECEDLIRKALPPKVAPAKAAPAKKGKKA